MKILINTPDFSFSGGVANHYKGLKPFWSNEVKHNFIGGRKGFPGPLLLIYDYIKFWYLCAFGNYDVILLNPSLGKTAIKRDALFLKIAKWFNIKTIVFFHGWSDQMVKRFNVDSSNFCKKFNHADKIIVLASAFKEDLIRWGITKPIYLSSTKVNDNFLNELNIENKSKDNNTILFLTRIETYKGIYIALEAFKLVKSQFPSVKLTIAGNGSQLEKAQAFVERHNIEDVQFLGNISGKLLLKTYTNSSIYILPSFSEGMPTTVLEAMAFGLPVISRPVGGLVDFFEEDKMGFLLKSFEPQDFAEKILLLLRNPEKRIQMGIYNNKYSTTNFVASKVTLKLEEVLTL